MADVIEKGLTATDLRRELRESGLQRAAEFSWRRCAKETLAVLAGAHAA